MNNSRRRQHGFTLVELVVVIVILGILAAVAIPRFASLQGDARAAKVNAAAGALKAAAAMAHSAWLSGGGTAATVTMEGASVAITNGYPTAASVMTAANLVDGVDGYTVASGVVSVTGATSATCNVTYTGAASGGAPTFAVTVSDCS